MNVHDLIQGVFILIKVEERMKAIYEEPTANIIFTVERKKESEDAQSCLTLCDPVDCSLPGSSVHGILQARVLEWVVIAFSLYFGLKHHNL